MKINIVDAGCGIGKTTALINKMNNDTSEQKYLFITPFLSEVDRIVKSCPNKNFIDPQSDNGGSKLNNIISLFEKGENIVTTHSLFKKFNNEMFNIIKENNYILVMDEVADTIEELSITKADLKTLSEQYVYIHPKTHMVEWIDDSYTGKFNEYMNMIKMNNVFAYTDKDNKIVSLLWMFPYKILESFKQVFILTYMFDGQIQKKYFDYFDSQYIMWYIKDFQLTPEVQKYDYSKTKQLINVCMKEKLNLIGWNKNSLSMSWFNRNKKSYKMIELQNNIGNFFRSYTNSQNEEILWTTFKEYKKDVQKKGFVKGFAAINSRATNKYIHKKAIAYVGNRFFKPTIKNFFSFNNISTTDDFEDKFALSELIQFVYRSAIRNGEPINVYIPSKRMRDLFLDWLKKPND